VYSVLLILLILDALVLMTVVLLQAGKGGGLAAMGAAGAGSDSLFGSRQAATLLTRATWWTGGLFIGLAFVLSLMSGRPAVQDSILRGTAPAPTGAPALPSVVDPVQTESPTEAAPVTGGGDVAPGPDR
jgi:preprotein translocase subunit SecG